MKPLALLLPPLVLASLGAASLAPRGEPRTFSLEDPKKVNGVSWLVDSPLEPIAGVASVVQGSLEFDPENPGATRGRIVIPVSSLRAPLEAMTAHLHSARWLDAEKYPAIEFVVTGVAEKSVSATRLQGPDQPTDNGLKEYTAEVTGDLSLHGRTKTISVPVRVSYMPDGLTQKMGRRLKGDLIRVRADFSIERADFGIDGGIPATIVGPTIELRCSFIASVQRE